jgi:hypothetical protein
MTTKHTNQKVYRADPKYVHIPDDQRAEVGHTIAILAADAIRIAAAKEAHRLIWTKPLCPGCYMVALVHAALTLAQENGQDQKELALSLSNAFAQVAETGEFGESIIVLLDKDSDIEAQRERMDSEGPVPTVAKPHKAKGHDENFSHCTSPSGCAGTEHFNDDKDHGGRRV